MTYLHSGASGDLVYALPAMREHSHKHGEEQFKIILGTNRAVPNHWNRRSAANIIPLLSHQPYVAAVELQSDASKWDVDCDGFRQVMIKHMHTERTLTSFVCDVLKVDRSCADTPWLTVDVAVHASGKPVVINRTGRYPNSRFPWRKIMQLYGPHSVFVGSLFEYERFCFAFGHIPYCPTDNALALARMIYGCRLFIGNQSLAYAIAEGLKHTTIQETSKAFPNCIWNRENATIFRNQPMALKTIGQIM